MVDRRFLIIFDNADEPSFLHQYWPKSGQGSIIVTSRSPICEESLVQHGLRLTEFSAEDGTKFLLSLLRTECPLVQKDMLAIEALSEDFGGLPLALRQAATYMKTRRVRPSEFKIQYSEHSEGIKGLQVPDYNKTLLNVWDMSYNTLPEASRVVSHCVSLLDPDSIPIAIFNAARGNHTYSRSLPNQFQIREAVMELSNVSLVDFDGKTETVNVHRLFQRATLDRLRKDEKRFRDISRFMIEAVNDFMPDSSMCALGKTEKRHVYEEIFRHALCLYNQTRGIISEAESLTMIRCMTKILKYA